MSNYVETTRRKVSTMTNKMRLFEDKKEIGSNIK